MSKLWNKDLASASFLVDLQGFEPWSKQETPKFSTRLFCLKLSEKGNRQTTSPFSYLLNLHFQHEES